MLQRYLAALGPRAAEHMVISLLPDGPLAASIAATGARVTSLGLAHIWQLPGALWRLGRLVRAARPQVVQGWMYHGCLAAWAGCLGRGRSGAPGLVWGIHHSLQDLANEKPATRAILRLMARLSSGVDAITYCSTVSQGQHEAIGFDRDAGVLIPNSVDAGTFHPDPGARARLGALCGLPPGRLIVGNVARSHPMKDHGRMVEAVARLVAAGHDVQAVLIGEGTSTGPAVAVARAQGISDRVSTLEARPDVAALVPGFDVFLLSSAWGEAFPLAVAEAMAAEVPCVVTDVGDCAMMVGDMGIVVPPGNAELQAGAVAELIEAGIDRRAELGRQARERVVALYSMERYVDLHDRVHSEALERRRVIRQRRAV